MRFKITITQQLADGLTIKDSIGVEAENLVAATTMAQCHLAAREGVTALSIKPMPDRTAYMRGYMQRRRKARLMEREEEFEQARKDFGC